MKKRLMLLVLIFALTLGCAACKLGAGDVAPTATEPSNTTEPSNATAPTDTTPPETKLDWSMGEEEWVDGTETAPTAPVETESIAAEPEETEPQETKAEVTEPVETDPAETAPPEADHTETEPPATENSNSGWNIGAEDF